MKALHQREVKMLSWGRLTWRFGWNLLFFTMPEYKHKCPTMVFKQRKIVKVILFPGLYYAYIVTLCCSTYKIDRSIQHNMYFLANTREKSWLFHNLKYHIWKIVWLFFSYKSRHSGKCYGQLCLFFLLLSFCRAGNKLGIMHIVASHLLVSPIPHFKQLQKLHERCRIIAETFLHFSVFFNLAVSKLSKWNIIIKKSDWTYWSVKKISQWQVPVALVSHEGLIYCMGLATVSTWAWQEIVISIVYKKQPIKKCQGIYLFTS